MEKTKLNTKSIARIAAVQAIYQYATASNELDANIETILMRTISFYKDKDVKNDHDIAEDINIKLKPSYNYMKELVHFAHDNINELDQIITDNLKEGWSLERLPKLLHACLRVAICELKFFPDTPRKCVINEYTSIAGDMLSDGEIGFVNSLLDNFSNNK